MTLDHRDTFSLQVDPGSGVALYQQVVDGVARAIASGALVAGDALPSVRDLAVRLTINLNTVARAYQKLQDKGLAESRRGVGLFVAADASVAPVPERLAQLDPSIGELVSQARQLGLVARDVIARLRTAFKED